MTSAEPSLEVVLWICCGQRFVATAGTWPEHQGRMVAAKLTAAGIEAQSFPIGERPANDQLCGAALAGVGAQTVEVVGPRLHHHSSVG